MTEVTLISLRELPSAETLDVMQHLFQAYIDGTLDAPLRRLVGPAYVAWEQGQIQDAAERQAAE